ncbi:tetratricopeptide repeat protein [bacterium]|nr:tetratricopeptide repeat protein [bacterium]
MIEAFVVLLIGSILIVVLNKMPEKGIKVEKHKKAIDKFFEAFHKTPTKKIEDDNDNVDEHASMQQAELSEKDKLLKEAKELLKEDKLKEAEEKYIEVLKIDEHDPESYRGLGNICFIKKDYKDAEEIFEKLTKISPKDGSNYCNLGMCCYKKDEFEKARENYEKALKIEKKPSYYKNLAITLIKLKEYDKALDNLLRSLDKNKKDKESFSLAISILDEIKDKKKQKKAATFLAKVNTKDSTLKSYLNK